MNILFLSLVDFDSIEENGIYTDLLRQFVKNDHDLFIISPSEKKISNEIIYINNKINILKPKIINFQKSSLIKKGISSLYLSFILKKSILKYFNKIKFDLILYTTPPTSFYKLIKYFKLRDKAKTYLMLKDIFPQNALDLNILSQEGIKGLIYKYYRSEEIQLYKTSDFIGCMSQANVDFLLRNNQYLDKDKIEVCPNSLEGFYQKFSLDFKKKLRIKYNLPLDKKIFVYGGNLGKPQGIDFVIECITKNEENDKSFILIIGSGTEYQKLSSFFENNNIYNSKLLFRLPKDEYDYLVKACDVGLIFLDNRFTIPNFPSRILSYMQSSMPVLAATDLNTDIGKVIEKGNFGYWCESKSVEAFNGIIKNMCDDKEITFLGNNAYKFFTENYTSKISYEIIIKHFDKKK